MKEFSHTKVACRSNNVARADHVSGPKSALGTARAGPFILHRSLLIYVDLYTDQIESKIMSFL